MGWKSALRSASAADRAYRKEVDRAHRQIDRALDKSERDAEGLRRKVASFEARVDRDLLKAFSVSYSLRTGLRHEPVRLSNDSFDLSLSLSSGDDEDGLSVFEPTEYMTESASVTPLALYFTQWATLIAFRVQNYEEKAFKCSWVRKSDPQSSKLFLLDADNSHYYYPTSTNLAGDVLKGHSREGLVCFPPIEEPTRSLEIHFNGLKLSSVRGRKEDFSFTYASESLYERVESAAADQSLEKKIEEHLETQLESMNNQAEKARPGRTSPIAWIALGLVVIVILFATGS